MESKNTVHVQESSRAADGRPASGTRMLFAPPLTVVPRTESSLTFLKPCCLALCDICVGPLVPQQLVFKLKRVAPSSFLLFFPVVLCSFSFCLRAI